MTMTLQLLDVTPVISSYEFVSRHQWDKTKHYQLWSSNSLEQYLNFLYTVEVQSQWHKSVICLFKVFRKIKVSRKKPNGPKMLNVKVAK